MRRRLRKKRRVGEFREDCFELSFQLDPSLRPHAIEEVIDAFIAMIESYGLQYGGGGWIEWSGIVQGPCRGSATDADRELVLNWLREHPGIVHASAGSLRDAWYGWD